MPAQQPNTDLLIKYLLHEVTAEEETFVTEWFASDSRNLHYFEAFEKIWLLTRFTHSTDSINVEEEWAILKNHIADNNTKPVPAGKLQAYPLYGQPPIDARKKRRNLFIAIAVAASIIAAIFIGRFLFVQPVVQSPVVVTTNKPKDSVALVLHHEANTTGKPKRLVLFDGTVILLEDKSEVVFTEPFAADYRSITLQGKANFKVAKDKNRPFTVFSDAIATTVLGTVFDVSAYPQASTITVRLYEGKVVVNAAADRPKKLQHPVYLSPGYEMLYNKQSASASVHPFLSNKSTPPPTNNTGPSNIDNPTIPKKKGSWFMFNNQPLSQVLDQLQEMYKTEIVYRKKDIQKLYFIGQFNREDSIEMILEQITRSHNLTLTRSNDTFIIKK